MKKIIKTSSLLISALFFVVTINAEEIKVSFLYMLKKYSENSLSYKSIELQHTQNNIDDYTDTYSLKSAGASIEDNEKQIKALEKQLSNAADYYEKESIRCNLEYRRIYQFELELNKAELELQSEFNSISAEFSEDILSFEKKKYEYELRSKFNELLVQKKRLEYLNLYQQYCSDNVKITESSLEIGYATQLDVENAEAELAAAESEAAECEMLIEQYEKEILLNSGETADGLAYEFLNKSDINETEMLERFKEVSCQEEIYEKQIQSNRDLIDKITDIQERLHNLEVKFGEDNTEYKERLTEKIDGAMAYYNNALEITENDLKEYEINLELYVSELLGRKDVCIAQVKAAEAALQAAETNIDVMNAFYAEGHVRELDMTEAHAELEKAEYDLISAQISLDNIIFAVENSVVM